MIPKRDHSNPNVVFLFVSTIKEVVVVIRSSKDTKSWTWVLLWNIHDGWRTQFARVDNCVELLIMFAMGHEQASSKGLVSADWLVDWENVLNHYEWVEGQVCHPLWFEEDVHNVLWGPLGLDWLVDWENVLNHYEWVEGQVCHPLGFEEDVHNVLWGPLGFYVFVFLVTRMKKTSWFYASQYCGQTSILNAIWCLAWGECFRVQGYRVRANDRSLTRGRIDDRSLPQQTLGFWSTCNQHHMPCQGWL